jgi:hypothetical protein
MVRLIAFDLDGTAFNEHKRMTAETKAALEQAAEAGIELVPATGRPFVGMTEDIKNLQGIRYILTTNGAGIYERDTGVCIHEKPMELSKFLPMLARLEKLDVMADAFVKGQAYMNEDKVKWISYINGPEEIKQFISKSRKRVKSQSEYLRKKGADVEKLTINFATGPDGKRIDYDPAWEIVKDYPEFLSVSGGMQNIEVTNKGISKASGLRWLGDKLGISMEEMMVFGDSGNDIEMIREAGIGIAMANAEPEVLQIADFVTKSNDESGIAYAIYKYLGDFLTERR